MTQLQPLMVTHNLKHQSPLNEQILSKMTQFTIEVLISALDSGPNPGPEPQHRIKTQLKEQNNPPLSHSEDFHLKRNKRKKNTKGSYSDLIPTIV